MKRDMDLVRKILLTIEESEGPPDKIRINGYDDGTVDRHLDLLQKAGLIEADVLRSGQAPYIMSVRVDGLTWAGHEFLDDARNDTVWAKAKKSAASVGGSVSLQVFRELLRQAMRGELGL